jgi:hypothetical protein
MVYYCTFCLWFVFAFTKIKFIFQARKKRHIPLLLIFHQQQQQKMLFSLLYFVTQLIYCIIDDILTFPTRPLVLFNHVLLRNLLSTILSKNGLLPHLFIFFTIILLCVCVLSLIKSSSLIRDILNWFVVINFIDAGMQLCGAALLISYPVSHTLLVTLTFQFLPFVFKFTPQIEDFLSNHLGYSRFVWFFIVISSRHMAYHQQDAQEMNTTKTIAFNCISIMGCVFTLTGTMFFQLIYNCYKGFTKFVHQLLHLWPCLVSLFWTIFTHPICHYIHRCFVLPIWNVICPFVLPLCMFTTFIVTCHSLWIKFTTTAIGCQTMFQLIYASTCLVSTVVLFLHACKITINVQSSPFALFVWHMSRIFQFPFMIGQRIFNGRLARWLKTGILKFLEFLFDFASNNPIFALPWILSGSGCIFYICFVSPPEGVILMANYISMLIKSMIEIMLPQQNTPIPIEQLLADCTILIALVATIQSATFRFCFDILNPIFMAQRWSSLSVEELEEIASAMTSPRQCPHCAYGPIDHSGCSNLSTHHGQNRTSNACPRCNFFHRNINAWPMFTPSSDNMNRNGVYAQRVWNDVVMYIRSASKLLILPMIILQISANYLQLSHSMSACLVLLYIVPWMIENRSVFSSMYKSPRRQQRWQQQQHLPTRTCCSSTSSTTTSINSNKSNLTIDNLVSQSQPKQIFLSEESTCSICLMEFSKDALQIVTSCEASVAQLLLIEMKQDACISLNCGHVFHQECIQQMLSSVSARHERCPNCRQPLTNSGSISASLFI